MPLSDAKTIPISNAIAALETMTAALKAYHKKALLYSDLENDRSKLSVLACELYAKIRSGGSPIQVDLADVVDAAMKSVLNARRSVEVGAGGGGIRASDLQKMRDGSLVRPVQPTKKYADEQTRIIYEGAEFHTREIEAKKRALEEAYKASKLRTDYSR